jgi:hypothetical protein
MKKALFAGFGLAVLLTPAMALAYLDPGTGGLLYQMGFALFTVVAGFLFVPFRTVKNLFLKMIGRPVPTSPSDSSADSEDHK